MSDSQRAELVEILSHLPYQYGYTLKENKDGSLSLIIGQKHGRPEVRARMYTKGNIETLMADAQEFVQFATSREDR